MPLNADIAVLIRRMIAALKKGFPILQAGQANPRA
jgi:hypothetical protein